MGGIFVLIQTLSFNGYLKVDYNKFKEDVEDILDVNEDGKLDEKDAEVAMKKAIDIVSYQMPSGSGFTAGLVMGLRA